MILREVTLCASNLGKTLDFYENGLGLTLVECPSDKLTFIVGRSHLTFVPAPRRRQPFYHLAFSVPFGQFDGAVRWLEQRTTILPFCGDHRIAEFPDWEARACYFHDPEGNILELIARKPLPDAPTSRFARTPIVGLSEIGIVTDSVELACLALSEQYGVPYFARGPRRPDFAAMGDDEGLFIVSQTGRGWWPTLRPAERHPLHVAIERNGVESQFQLV
jgi:catechol 2,3-dioxygenase-like lactoylglutathione lyase family enzyme